MWCTLNKQNEYKVVVKRAGRRVFQMQLKAREILISKVRLEEWRCKTVQERIALMKAEFGFVCSSFWLRRFYKKEGITW